MRRLAFMALLVLLVGVSSIPAGAGPPGAEIQISDDWTVDCGSEVFLDLHREGWADEHPGGLTFHITMTWANSAGDTWTYEDTGSVRYFATYNAVAGHTNDVGGDSNGPGGEGDGNYGRWVIDTTTGDFYAVGSYRGMLNEAACNALT